MDKRKKTSDGNTATVKKKRLVITLEQKCDVIERHERGHSNSKIGRDVGMPESTVRNIIKHAGEIKKKGKVASTFCGLQTTTRNRSVTMIEMERLLAVWIDDCNKKCIPLSRAAIQTKASSLFKAVKENGNEVDSEETFSASGGWFDRFKNRVHLHHVKITGEIANADENMAANYPDVLKKIIGDGGYTDQPIFNVGGTGLFWKKIPFRTYIFKKEKTQPGFKGSTNHVTVFERECGHDNSKTGQDIGMPESTVQNIIKHTGEIQEKDNVASAYCGLQTTTRNRSVTMIEMEPPLTVWIEDCNDKHIPHSKTAVQTNAPSLFKVEKENGNEIDNEETFAANSGCFTHFKNQGQLHDVKISEKAATTDEDMAAKFPDVLKKIIEEGGYTDQQIFNVDETGLFWKRMPSRTYISKKENTQPGFKVSRDRLTLLLGGNAEGDFKLKPMLVYWSQNPRALRGYNQQSLPVLWRSNKKAWMTKAIFEDWFSSYFSPAVEKYCKDSNIAFKALLILDNAPGHPTTLSSLCENIKVIFLPPNTTSLLQPMNQGTIATFKAYYLRKIFEQAATKTIGNDAMSLTDFWENYNIRDAIENIHHAWQQITANNMREVWKYILPHCANSSFEGFLSQKQAVIEEITNTGKQLGFDELESDNVLELLESHSEELTTDDFLHLEQQRVFEDIDDDTEEANNVQMKEFTLKEFEDIFQALEVVKQKIMDADPDVDRRMQIHQDVDKALCTYQRMYEDLKKEKTIQSTLLKYIKQE
ncbi:tigger transposable element-derived protein 1-like [Dromiciops gliroides]|uniref:tigger transposable element-derived protein 1-like n=1 Tax=Dromiciops gliroides TaxID=33562 RepID=UPI001CC6A42A|nr:tigger transposable element-derived protein 1-like [Dromiciops gliroides]XP_043835159.1 tigger transposable element-derived protein 1-like [Dromiciops gliroides]XP_043835160.1 tigger transposable element-derived protein 1-like [Dromiciops gliroides]